MAQTKRCRYPCLAQVLGNEIAQMRKERHWSQDRLAAECGRTHNCIQQSEDYEHIPTVDTLLLIFSALEIRKWDAVRLIFAAMAAFQVDLLNQRRKEEKHASLPRRTTERQQQEPHNLWIAR